MTDAQKWILHVEDEGRYHINLLEILERVAKIKGISFDKVKPRVMHVGNYKDAVRFMGEHRAQIAAAFIDNDLNGDKCGESLLTDVHTNSSNALLAWASSSRVPRSLRQPIYEIGKPEHIASLTDETISQIMDGHAVDAVGSSQKVEASIRAASEAIDALGIAKTPSAIEMARRENPKPLTDHAIRPENREIG